MKAIRPAVAKIAAVLLTLGQADSGGGGRVHWVKPPELPTITGDAWVAPLGVAPPMLPTLAIIALVGDYRARRSKYPCEIFRCRKRAYRRQWGDANCRSRTWRRWWSPRD